MTSPLPTFNQIGWSSFRLATLCLHFFQRLERRGQLNYFLVESEADAIRVPGMCIEQLLASELSDALEGVVTEGVEA